MFPKFLPQGFCKLLYRFQVVGAESLSGHLNAVQKQVEVGYFLLDFTQIFFIIAGCICKSWSVEHCDSYAVFDNFISSYLREIKQEMITTFNSNRDFIMIWLSMLPQLREKNA